MWQAHSTVWRTEFVASQVSASALKQGQSTCRVDSSDEETQGSEDGDEDETAMMSNKCAVPIRHNATLSR